MRWAWLWALGVLAGCSDDDLLSSQLRGTESGVVVLKTTTPMGLLAFRHEDDPRWKVYPSEAATEIAVDVHGPYRALFVCEEAPGFTIIIEIARTLDDERRFEHACLYPLPTHRVFGTLTDPNAWLALQFQQGFTFEPDGFFEMIVEEGVRDLLLFPDFDATAIAVRRDLAIFEDLDLGAIDVAQERPTPMERRSFKAINPAPEESLSASIGLHVRGTSIFMGSGKGLQDVLLIPQAILRPTDRQRVELRAFTRGTPGNPMERQVRTVLRESSAAPSEIVFPEGMAGVAFERASTAIAATWSSLPPSFNLALARSSGSDVGFIAQLVEASRAFVEATDPMRLVFDLSDVPGFKPEWHPQPDSTFDAWELNAFLNGDAVEVTESRTSATPDAGALQTRWPLAYADAKRRMAVHRAVVPGR